MAKSEVEKLVDRLSKTYGTLRIAGHTEDSKEYISTGNLALDLALEGGVAMGYAVELSGKSGSGKTLLMQLMLADFHKKYNDGMAVWLDREKAFWNKRGEELGIDLNRTIVVDPMDVTTVTDAEVLLVDILKGFPKEIPKFIAIDSISSFSYDGDPRKAEMGKRAKAVHSMFRSILPFINNNTLLVFTNQITFKIGVLFGDNTTVTSGEGVKYYTSYRLKLDDRKQITDPTQGNEIVGNYIVCHIIKTRSGPNHRSVVVPFKYASGIDYYGGYARLLWKRGYVKPNNVNEFKAFKQHTFTYNNQKYNEFEMEKLLEENPELKFDSYPIYNILADPNDVVEGDDLE